jgi:hypothetical protein
MFVTHDDFESSNVKSFSYDEDTSTLRMEFKSDNSEYEYYNVPKSEYEGLVAADSKGTYGHQNIYKRYGQARIR